MKQANHARVVAFPLGVYTLVCVNLCVVVMMRCWCMKMNINDQIRVGKQKRDISSIFIQDNHRKNILSTLGQRNMSRL